MALTFWITFTVIITVLIVFDLFILGRRDKHISVRLALMLSAVYIVIAIMFGAAIYIFQDSQKGLEYFTGYALEKSLSLDNIFVFLVLFKQLEVPENAQHKVLFWGVVGALVMRAILIALGAALLHYAEWILYFFGVLVIASGIKLFFESGEGNLDDNRIYKFLYKRLPMTDGYKGKKLWINQDGRRLYTPLMMALLMVEISDLIFALDSIPAIFGITRDPFIVYTSNAFAVLGLRALYFAVAGLVDRFKYLHYGLSLLLVVIGFKMIIGHIIEIPIWVTLGLTVTVIGGSIAISWVLADRHKQEKGAEAAG